MKKQLKSNWAVDANCLCQDGTTESQKNLPVNTPRRSVVMPGSNATAGTPVNTKLAIRYMRRFLKFYKLYLRTAEEKASKFHADNDKDALLELFKNHVKFHQRVYHMSYGMTMEKDHALRLLSQPGCEGLRFYMCSKDMGGKEVISLVVVGVDHRGYDLNFDPVDSLVSSKADGVLDDVSDDSLGVEYNTPPYTDGGGSGGVRDYNPINPVDPTTIDPNRPHAEEYKECFVLLNMARNRKLKLPGDDELEDFDF